MVDVCVEMDTIDLGKTVSSVLVEPDGTESFVKVRNLLVPVLSPSLVIKDWVPSRLLDLFDF